MNREKHPFSSIDALNDLHNYTTLKEIIEQKVNFLYKKI